MFLCLVSVKRTFIIMVIIFLIVELMETCHFEGKASPNLRLCCGETRKIEHKVCFYRYVTLYNGSFLQAVKPLIEHIKQEKAFHLYRGIYS